MNITTLRDRFRNVYGPAATLLCVGLFVAALMAACSSSDDPIQDNKPPLAVNGVEANNIDRIVVAFNQSVDVASAQDVGNYSVVEAPASPAGPAGASGAPAVIIDAVVAADGRRVILWTEPLSSGKSYDVTVSGVKDTGGEPLASAATTTVVSKKMSGIIHTWAGTGPTAFGAWDGDNHILTKSRFFQPADLTWTSTGLYILDWNNHRVRHLTQQNTLVTVIGNFLGDGDPDQMDLIYPGVPGTTINLNHPTDLNELPDGRILLSAWHNHKLRVWNPADGLAYVMVGRGAGYAGDGTLISEDSRLNQPSQAAVASNGDIYIMDQRNQCVRKIEADTGLLTTVVGTPMQPGFEGDGGAPADCKLNMPTGSNPSTGGALCFDGLGRLYISDTNNERIRRVDFNSNTIVTVAGNGTSGFSGDGGDATAASLNNPRDIEMGPDGRLYIADEFNNRIRAVDLTANVIVTVAGDGRAAYAGDGGPATAASLNHPHGIAFDSDGYLYIADAFNHRIRRVSP